MLFYNKWLFTICFLHAAIFKFFFFTLRIEVGFNSDFALLLSWKATVMFCVV